MSLRRIIIVLSAVFNLFGSIGLLAQNWTWDTVVSPGGPIKLSRDGFGHIYAFVPGDTVLKKYDLNGPLQWQIDFPSNLEIRNVACSTDSSIYLVAVFSDTVSIGSASVASRGGKDFCLAKFTQAGNLVWLTAAGSRNDDFAGDLCMNGTDLMIVGSASDTTFFNQQPVFTQTGTAMFVARYTSAGILDTVKVATQVPVPMLSNSSWGAEIETDFQGNTLVMMGLYGKVKIDTFSLENYYATYILKFDTTLALQWVAIAEADYWARADNLAVNSQGDIAFIGHVSGKYLSTSTIRGMNKNGGNPVIYYHEPSGQLRSIDTDSCDNIYFTGFHNKWNYAANPPTVYYLTTGKVSPAGNLEWVTADSSLNYRGGTDLLVTGPNRCHIAGEFGGLLVLKDSLVNPFPFAGFFHAALQFTFGMPANTTPLANRVICENKSTVLAGSAGGSVSWYQTAQSTSVVATGNTFTTPALAPGIHTWYVEAATCSLTSGRSPITVTVNSLPVITVNSGSICAQQSFSIVPAGGVSYSIPGGKYSVSPLVSMTYIITGTDANGCVNSAASIITVHPPPVIKINGSPDYVCPGETVTLSCSGPPSYTWSSGSGTSPVILTLTATTTFSIASTNTLGCTGRDNIVLHVTSCHDLQGIEESTPYTFYPNPANDFLCIGYNAAQDIKIDLLNVAGQRVCVQATCVPDTKETTLNLSTLPRGIYFVEVASGGQRHVKKIILE